MSTAQDAIDRARDQLHDTDAAAYRWADAELINYLNDGLRQISTIKPEANVVEASFSPTAGSAIQSLPTGGVKFLKALANEAAAGGRTGPLRYCEKDVLDSFKPDWMLAASAGADTDDYYEHYMHDPRDPTRFYLYPLPEAGTKVRIEYTALPTEITAVGDTFPLSDQYLEAASQYVIYRALTKEGRYAVGPESRRRELWEAFLMALGIKRKASREVSPEVNRPPEASA